MWKMGSVLWRESREDGGSQTWTELKSICLGFTFCILDELKNHLYRLNPV